MHQLADDGAKKARRRKYLELHQVFERPGGSGHLAHDHPRGPPFGRLIEHRVQKIEKSLLEPLLQRPGALGRGLDRAHVYEPAVRLAQNFQVELFLAPEVVVDGGVIDPGQVADLARRGAVVALLGKHRARRLDEAPPRSPFPGSRVPARFSLHPVFFHGAGL